MVLSIRLAATSQIRDTTVLDNVYEQLQSGPIGFALDELIEHLRARREEEPETWQAYAQTCQEHPVRSLLHQDPFT